jgi:hypothetical protein
MGGRSRLSGGYGRVEVVEAVEELRQLELGLVVIRISTLQPAQPPSTFLLLKQW